MFNLFSGFTVLFILIPVALCAAPVHVYHASRYAKLDSDVIKGGGADDTKAIQALLDKARDGSSVILIMDGAALVTGLTVWSNTTIECINQSCGFFLKDASNIFLVRNGHASLTSPPEKRDRNITLKGGTWNHNAKGQQIHVEMPEADREIYRRPDGSVPKNRGTKAFEFYGVENLTMSGMTIMNQRNFTVSCANFENVTVKDVKLVLNDYMRANSQDGFHFFGPGRFLTLTGLTGTAGDDFIAITPDEMDGVSSVTDVFIDGVSLNGSDQGIRLLCRQNGTLDRVLIKNVTGTFNGFGFIIDPWYEGSGGHYKNITIDTVDLHCSFIRYDYMKPFIFKLGGNIDDITLKNIHYHGDEPHYILTAGGNYMRDLPSGSGMPTNIRNLTAENIYIHGDGKAHIYFDISDNIHSFTLRNVIMTGCHPESCLMGLNGNAAVGDMFIDKVTGVSRLFREDPGGNIARLTLKDIVTADNR